MDGLYKIGAVSKITGINIPTLRSWENKFDIVTPTRVNGTQRGYTKQDLDKLALIQALIDSGDSISSLRGLSLEQLQSRLLSNDSSKNDSNSSNEKPLESNTTSKVDAEPFGEISHSQGTILTDDLSSAKPPTSNNQENKRTF
mgnify:CR=1 FL=1